MSQEYNSAVKFLTDNAFKIFGLFIATVFSITAGLLTAFAVGATAWAWNVSTENAHMQTSLKNIEAEMGKMNRRLEAVPVLDKRLTYIETTRFTDVDAEKIKNQLSELDKRVREVEYILKKAE